MKVGYLQFNPEFGKCQHNLQKIEDFLLNVNADIIVLPELAFTGYYFEDRSELNKYAEIIDDSNIIKSLIRLCIRNDFYLVAGFAEKEHDKIYNSAITIGPKGLVNTYRKLHLFNTEKEYFDPGNLSIETVTIRGAKIGLMICFDWIFPEVARCLTVQGADLICHPSNLVLDYCQNAMITRSLENSIYSITANRIGSDKRPMGNVAFTGQSQIVDPQGKVLVSSNNSDEELVIVDVDIALARQKNITPNNHIINDRRTKFYNSICKK